MNDGGPAFPRVSVPHPEEPDLMILGAEGMSLRDWFAGEALTGLIEGGTIDSYLMSRAPTYARCAYALADAMLKERKVVP